MPTFHKSLSVVPPGEYLVQIVSAVEGVSKNENEMITLRLSVEGSTHLFSDHLVFIESSAWKIAQFLTAMEEEVVDGKDIEATDYPGRRARALVGVDEFNGQPQNKIDKWLPPVASTAISGSAQAG